MKKIVIAFVISLLFTVALSAQVKLHYWGDGETFLQEQASFIIEEVYKTLAAYPPGTSAGNERRLALFALDALFHDTRLDHGTAFLAYMDRMAGNVAEALGKNKPTGNVIRVFRFYNHGFIVQTPSVTVGIDLVRGGRADHPFISEPSMRSVVEQCDIMFITHKHGDHTDLSVIKMFCEQGKQVIVPEEIGEGLAPQLRVLRGVDMIRETIRVTGKNVSLRVQVYPGKQGNMLNNVYAITLPEGKTIMHTGDQDYSDDLVAKISSNVKVDVLFVQCWMLPMEKFVSGVKPVLVIPGHENEMMHTIDHREAYWLTFRRMSGVEAPYVVMGVGENYLINF